MNVIEKDLAEINKMSREEMAELYRFAPVGHRFFIEGTPQWEAFNKRFNELGRMSPEISKKIGWTPPNG